MNYTLVIDRVWPGIARLGGAIFTGKRCDDGSSLRCLARANRIFRTPSVGELWAVDGKMKTHPLYGDQLEVERAIPAVPVGRLIVSYLAYNPSFVGVGKAKAERLWSVFGDELPKVLTRGDAEALRQHIGDKAIESLLANWKERPETEVVAFLDRYGFPLSVTNKALRIWPVDTIRKLQANPYRLLAVANWTETDAAAQRLGLGIDDPRRLIGAVEATLYNQLADHHTVSPRHIVLGGLRNLLPTLSRDLHEKALRLALADKACVESCLGYSTVGAAHMERQVSQWLNAKIEGADQRDIFERTLGTIVDDEVAAFRISQGKDASDEQRAAVKAVFENKLFILTGGAGTGKTTVLRLVHKIASQTGRQVVQMCLAGRAAKRLSDVTGREAYTISRFFLQHDKLINRDGEPIVIIDEASMVDLPAFYLLSKILPRRATVVLVGDAAQLPPIGFGLVFHLLASPASKFPRQELTRVYRQLQTSGIPTISEHIRRVDDPNYENCGRVLTLPPYPGPGHHGVFLVEAAPDRIASNVMALYRSLTGQILCATHRGDAGVDKLNSRCHRQFVGATEDTLNTLHLPGEPVIYGENDYNRTTMNGSKSALWNGSMGKIVEVRHDSEYGLVVDFDGERHLLEGDDLNHLQHAYAITVHRAQGSQFPAVIIPLVRARNVDRTWIYTAITRAEQTAILVGARDVLEQAIVEKPQADQRRVTLSF